MYIHVAESSFCIFTTGQCVASDELESLRYRLYSELSESKKEIYTLRNDLQYWKNETLTILKNYLLNKGNLNSHALQAIDEKLNIIQLQTGQSDSCNITDGTLLQKLSIN